MWIAVRPSFRSLKLTGSSRVLVRAHCSVHYGLGAYCASKHALEAIAASLRDKSPNRLQGDSGGTSPERRGERFLDNPSERRRNELEYDGRELHGI
jgi:hypothetical protein